MAIIVTPAVAPAVPSPCCGSPVVLNPPALQPVSCTEQGILTAPVSKVNGRQILSRMRTFSLQAGQCTTLDWVMLNRDGLPVDLTGCGFTTGTTSASDSSSLSVSSLSADAVPPLPAGEYQLIFRMRESLHLGTRSFTAQSVCEVVDAAQGQIRIPLVHDQVQNAGVYFGEVALVRILPDQPDPFGCIVFSNIFYLILNHSEFANPRGPLGPPSIMEIRLHLRDSAGAENYLLDNLKFADSEIALAIRRPVEYWNEVPPPIQVFTTRDFPFRHAWLDGICGNLFLIAAEQFRANNLEYSAAGVQVNDQNKEPNYEQAAQRRLQDFKDFVGLKKVSMNLEQCYGEVGSMYRGCW